MDYTSYIPGTMSNSDFYQSMINDALSGAFSNPESRYDNIDNTDSPAFKDYYMGDVSSDMIGNVDIQPSTDNGYVNNTPQVNKSYSTYTSSREWSPSERLLERIKQWEGSSMKTNVPFREVRRQFVGMSPNLNYLSDNQKDALYSYYYNLRPQTYKRQIVPLLRQLNGYNDTDTLERIKSNINVGMNRTNLPGLKKRRLAEQKIFEGGNYAYGGDMGDMDAVTPFQSGTGLTNYNSNIGNLQAPSLVFGNTGIPSFGKLSMPFAPKAPNFGARMQGLWGGITSGAGLSNGVKSFLGKPGVGGLVSAASGVVGGLIGGKNQSGVGNALGKAGDVVGMIPGPWGTIGNAALHVVGGLTNAAFGSNINKAFVNQTEQQSGKQLSWNSMAQSSDQLLNDAKNLSMLNNVNKSQVGSDGWFSHKASRETDRLNQKINEANDRAYSNLFNAADNISDNTSLGMMANYSAYGGPLNFTRDNVGYPHNYSWLAEGGPLKKVSDSQVMDDNTLYTKLPDEYDSDPSIKYHAYLPNVTVYGEKPRRESANKPMEGLPFLNAATLGLANNLSLSHNIGVVSDIINPNKTWSDVANSQIYGNSGIVSDNFQKSRPLTSATVNMATDIIGGAIGSALNSTGLNIKKLLNIFKIGDERKLYNIETNTERAMSDKDYNTYRRLLDSIGTKPVYDTSVSKESGAYGRLVGSTDVDLKKASDTLGKVANDRWGRDINIDFGGDDANNIIDHVTFKNPINGKVVNGDIPYIQKVNSTIHPRISDYYGTANNTPIVHLMHTSSPKVVYDPENKFGNIRNAIKEYEDQINNIAGEDGRVMGSASLTSGGDITTIPKDVDILTTDARLPRLKGKFKFTHSNETSGGTGEEGFSPMLDNGNYKFGFDVIHEENGKAYGKHAHEIASMLHPEEMNRFYKKATKEAVGRGLKGSPKWYDVRLPYSSEELFSEMNKPGALRNKGMIDFMSSIKSDEKFIQRYSSAMVNPNISVERFNGNLTKLAKSQMGKEWKSFEDVMPDFNFDNIEENKKILDRIGLPRYFAKDKDTMKKVMNYMYYQDTVNTRGIRLKDLPKKNYESVVKAMQGNATHGGGTLYGNVGYSTKGAKGAGGDITGIYQAPFSNDYSKIKSPSAYLEALNNSNLSRRNYTQKEIDQIKELSPYFDKYLSDMGGTPEEISNNMKSQQNYITHALDELDNGGPDNYRKASELNNRLSNILGTKTVNFDDDFNGSLLSGKLISEELPYGVSPEREWENSGLLYRMNKKGDLFSNSQINVKDTDSAIKEIEDKIGHPLPDKEKVELTKSLDNLSKINKEWGRFDILGNTNLGDKDIVKKINTIRNIAQNNPYDLFDSNNVLRRIRSDIGREERDAAYNTAEDYTRNGLYLLSAGAVAAGVATTADSKAHQRAIMKNAMGRNGYNRYRKLSEILKDKGLIGSKRVKLQQEFSKLGDKYNMYLEKHDLR